MGYGYKVVKCCGNTFMEDGDIAQYCSSWQTGGEGKVYYNIGRKTNPLPGHGPLCVFSNLRYAVAYIGKSPLSYYMRGQSYAVFKCRYTASRSIFPWIPDIRRGGKLKLYGQNTWNGQVLADRVTLLSRVDCSAPSF